MTCVHGVDDDHLMNIATYISTHSFIVLNFESLQVQALIVHGMSAISVFGETVAVRLLCVVSFLMLFTIGGLVTSMLIRFCTHLSIPGWATNLTGIFGIVMLNLLLLAIFSVLMMLNSRDRLSFLPIRDWQYFIEKSVTIHG